MRALRAVGRFVTDWRNAATVLASILVALLAVTVIDGLTARKDAYDAVTAQANTARAAQKAATRRIDLLTAGQQRLSRQVGQLIEENAALRQQVRDMGGRPTVIAGDSVIVRIFPSPSPSPSRRSSEPSTSPPPRSSPRPSPSPTCRPLPIIGCSGRARR